MKHFIILLFALFIKQDAFSQVDSCDGTISFRFDKFENKYTLETKFSDEKTFDVFPIVFSKVIGSGKTSYYVYLSTDRSSPDYSLKGVTILLSNGKRITRPVLKVDCEYMNSSSEWSFSAFFELSQTELNLLCSTYITDFRLGYIDVECMSSIKSVLVVRECFCV